MRRTDSATVSPCSAWKTRWKWNGEKQATVGQAVEVELARRGSPRGTRARGRDARRSRGWSRAGSSAVTSVPYAARGDRPRATAHLRNARSSGARQTPGMSPRELLIETTPSIAPARALEALSTEQAERRQGALHTIAEIVAHLAFWQDWFRSRCQGGGRADAAPRPRSAGRRRRPAAGPTCAGSVPRRAGGARHARRARRRRPRAGAAARVPSARGLHGRRRAGARRRTTTRTTSGR